MVDKVYYRRGEPIVVGGMSLARGRFFMAQQTGHWRSAEDLLIEEKVLSHVKFMVI